MSLQRLARELDETARQTAGMVDGVTQALEVLADTTITPEAARREAARMIIAALQGQDRIEQRCHNMALAVRQFALLPPDNATGNFTKVVQRVPVRIRLEGAPDTVSLRPGMSVELSVDTRK